MMIAEPVSNRLFDTFCALAVASIFGVPFVASAPRWPRALGYTLIGLAWFGLLIAIIAHIWGAL